MAVTALELVAPWARPVGTGAPQVPSALRCAKLVPSSTPDSMICSAPGALADGSTHGVRPPFTPVAASVRLIDPCSTPASGLGVNASVSASAVPLCTRGKAATTDGPAKASDGTSLELVSSVEIFVHPTAAWARPGEPPIAI